MDGWIQEAFERSPNQFVRSELARMYGGRCAYCGRRRKRRGQLTCDHVVPLAAGGQSWRDNLVPCCRPCNHLKGQESLEDFRALLASAVVANLDNVSKKKRAWWMKLKSLASHFLVNGRIVFYFERARPAFTSPVLLTLAKSSGHATPASPSSKGAA